MFLNSESAHAASRGGEIETSLQPNQSWSNVSNYWFSKLHGHECFELLSAHHVCDTLIAACQLFSSHALPQAQPCEISMAAELTALRLTVAALLILLTSAFVSRLSNPSCLTTNLTMDSCASSTFYRSPEPAQVTQGHAKHLLTFS